MRSENEIGRAKRLAPIYGPAAHAFGARAMLEFRNPPWRRVSHLPGNTIPGASSLNADCSYLPAINWPFLFRASERFDCPVAAVTRVLVPYLIVNLDATARDVFEHAGRRGVHGATAWADLDMPLRIAYEACTAFMCQVRNADCAEMGGVCHDDRRLRARSPMRDLTRF